MFLDNSPIKIGVLVDTSSKYPKNKNRDVTISRSQNHNETTNVGRCWSKNLHLQKLELRPHYGVQISGPLLFHILHMLCTVHIAKQSTQITRTQNK